MAATTCSLQDVIESTARRALGRQPGQQPAGVHEVPLPGPAARAAGSWWSTRTSSPGSSGTGCRPTSSRPLFGTKMCDLHVPVRPGGRRRPGQRRAEARCIERGAVDEAFVADAHRGLGRAARPRWTGQPLDDLLAAAGIDRPSARRLRRRLYGPRGAVLLWSMGITQHRDGVDGVRAIVNLALARGNVGRDGAGLMPIRGHSGVQGGAEMGAYATALPGRRCRSTPSTPPRWPSRGASRCPPSRAHRARDGRRGRAGRARRAVDVGRQLPRRAARPAAGSRRRWAGCRCGSTRTWC